jgi:hypothetical protein
MLTRCAHAEDRECQGLLSIGIGSPGPAQPLSECRVTLSGGEPLLQRHAGPRHRCHQRAKYGVDGFSIIEKLSHVRV